MAILSAAHQLAKELPPDAKESLALFDHFVKTGDGEHLSSEMQRLQQRYDAAERTPVLWEPISVYGWEIKATMYRKDGELWWLLHAVRRNEQPPSAKDVALLDKVLEVVGADGKRDMIIGPHVAPPPGGEMIPFGWWTWRNVAPLYEVQINRNSGKDSLRIVRQGSTPDAGFETISLSEEDPPASGS